MPPVSIPIQVNIAIQLTAGIDNPDPAKLSLNSAFSKLNFDDADLMRLAKRLNAIISKYNATSKISPLEISDCDKIQDCIDLVVEKCSSK